MSPRIAVHPNRTNPATGRPIGADRVAALSAQTTTPERPDNVIEQIALIERAIATRADAVVFTPVYETAVNDAILASMPRTFQCSTS